MADRARGGPAGAAAQTMNPLDALRAAVLQGQDDEAEALVPQITQDPRWIDELRAWLHDPNPDVRWWAVRTLAAYPAGTPQVADALRHALQDPDPEVRAAAALGLRQHPTPDAIPELRRLLEAEDAFLARLAAEALAALGPAATAALVDVLRHGNPAARREAARALAQTDDPEAIEALFHALDDPSPLVNLWAEDALHRRGVGMMFWTFGE